MAVLSTTSNLVVASAPKPYSLLVPAQHLPRTDRAYQQLLNVEEWESVVELLRNETVIALDFETRGTDPTLPDTEVVGMGLAGRHFSCYLHRLDDREHFDYILFTIMQLEHIQWIAHNVSFDGLWLRHKLGRHVTWHVDTYALYRHLATEGWLGQKWGLKDAMQDLLMWSDTNTQDLDDWLRNNGYVNKSGNPLKGEMWRAPSDILGKYCVLDVEATYLLYVNILEPVYSQFPALVEYHSTEFMSLLYELIDQRLCGIIVDRQLLGTAFNEIADKLDTTLLAIRNHPEVVEHINSWERAACELVYRAEPEKYLRKKERQEPPRYKKDGTESRNWIKWQELESRPPVLSKNWEKWNEKAEKTGAGLNPDCQFNLRSGDHLRWLFYDQLGHEAVEFTDTGLPCVDVDSLSRFGEVGKLLEEYLLLHKEMGFVEAYLELTEKRVTVHAGFRAPGTLTGRLSGTSPNLQQLPKSRRFLQCLTARPGHVWIDADFTALEPVVCTELSGDPALMQVYGPNAEKGTDIYLHTGAGIPALASRIRSEGYVPGKLTPEIVAHVKKVCKKERSICKVVYLSSSYGAGPKKIHKTLQMQGVAISFEEVAEIHRQYWDLYGGIKKWERKLINEWRRNGGWVLNGIGRPIGVHADYTKDIVNRVVQSTGHDILVKYVDHLRGELHASQISYNPIVIDFHDEVIIEVPESQVQDAVLCFGHALSSLNGELGGTIPLRIVPQIVSNFAEAKLED